MEAEVVVDGGTDEVGGVHGAALKRRIDFRAGQQRRAGADLGEALGHDAAGHAQKQAVEIVQ